MLHNPSSEFSGSDMRKYPETPDRISRIISAVKNLNNEEFIITQPKLCNEDVLNLVHNKDYIQFLQDIPDIQEEAPTIFPYPKGRIKTQSSFHSKLGYYLNDPSTPVTLFTYKSALASVSSAVACTKDLLHNEIFSIGLSRPPGHHAMANIGGGYCFFNNIAIAAKLLVNANKSVSILDLDYHHGNGTQDIFYKDSNVQYVSIHANTLNNYPYYWGFPDEVGEGEGKGFNKNNPISGMTNNDQYRTYLEGAIDEICEYNPEILLVSMGFDCYYLDKIAGMRLTAEFYAEIGNKLSHFSKIGVLLEGGYHDDIGSCFVNLISGLQ